MNDEARLPIPPSQRSPRAVRSTPDLVVEVTAPNGESWRVQAPKGRSLWVGRDAKCDVVLPSPQVSRRHAELRSIGVAVEIVDQSANGTLVDGVLLCGERRAVEHGARLGVGPFTVVIERRAHGDCPSAPLVPVQAGCAEAPATQLSAELRRRIHRLLLDRLDLAALDRSRLDASKLRPGVLAALERIVRELAAELPPGLGAQRLVGELADEALGLGPLEGLLKDPAVSEIMVVDPSTIFVERHGRMEQTALTFTDAELVRAVIERIVTPLGRRIDESSPLVDARLSDGSRVNAIIPPLALRGPCITIRKFRATPLAMSELVGFGSLSEQMARFLQRCVRARKNIVISGGTGSGKTTLLNVLSAAIPAGERVITIEDAAELRLAQPHVVSLESRPPNMEGRGEYSIRDLVRNALRMRPDRIVVGECRGGEALDMLQAMNTGHEGSMTTTHANSPREAVQRLETLCLMAGLDLPIRAVRAQIASSVHVIVQQNRGSDGSRRIVSIAEVRGLDEQGELELFEIFGFARTSTGANNEVIGEYRASGYVPSFLPEFVTLGLATNGEYL